jgi:hypothetical protein
VKTAAHASGSGDAAQRWAAPRDGARRPHRDSRTTQVPAELKTWIANDADGAVGYARDRSPRVLDLSCSEYQHRPESSVPSREPHSNPDRRGQVREQHDEMPATHQRHRKTMRPPGDRVMPHEMAAGRRHGGCTDSEVRHGGRRWECGSAEDLQRRINSPCPAAKSATAHAGLIVAQANGAAATTVSTNNGSSTEGLGVAPSPATWLATALVKRTDGRVSARTQRSAVSFVIANIPGTPANLTARNTANPLCTDPETRKGLPPGFTGSGSSAPGTPPMQIRNSRTAK